MVTLPTRPLMTLEQRLSTPHLNQTRIERLFLKLAPINVRDGLLGLRVGLPIGGTISLPSRLEIVVADIDETRYDGEAPMDYVRRLSLAKATVVASKIEEGLVLGADTTVAIDDHILEKPTDDEDARRMLKLLSGRWHEVLTGVTLVRRYRKREPMVAVETTKVRFAELSDAEIDWYVSTGEPLDKAGAYGIQEKAALFIEEIQGDYFNVMGLPVRLVYKLIKQA